MLQGFNALITTLLQHSTLLNKLKVKLLVQIFSQLKRLSLICLQCLMVPLKKHKLVLFSITQYADLVGITTEDDIAKLAVFRPEKDTLTWWR